MSNNNSEGSKESRNGLLGIFCGAKKEVNTNGEKCSCNKSKKKCPPMPCFNTDGCLPTYLIEAPKPNHKLYPAPPNDEIIPISQMPGLLKESKDDDCGNDSKEKYKDCLLFKEICPQNLINGNKDSTPTTSGGIFSKISSIFTSKK